MDSDSEPFPVRQIAEVEPIAPEQQWLIEQLWLTLGVGVLGGTSKTCKTWIAAEFAMATASGTDAFGRFPVRQPGPVLFFGAEDRLPALRTRFDGIAAQRDVRLDRVPLYLLDVIQLRIDRLDQLARLSATVAAYQPRLLVLDPFVRLARVDENSAAEVSGVLGSLRELQRTHDLAILLVHHTRKASGASPTLAFRGSGDFGAWGDSNLHLTRRGDDLQLRLEHRSAPAPDPLLLRLVKTPTPHVALATSDEPLVAADGLQQALLERLASSPRPHSTSELRESVRRRKADVVAALGELEAARLASRTTQGWIRVDPAPVQAVDPDGQRSLFPA